MSVPRRFNPPSFLSSLLLLAAIGCAWATPALSQVTADRRVVGGVVSDERGRPIVDASVIIRSAERSTRLAGDVTDALGRFELIVRLPTTPGKDADLEIVASHMAYGTTSTLVELAGVGRAGAADVTLVLRRSVLPQPEVVVTADRALEGVSPITIENLDAEALRRLPTTKDVPTLLEKTPSITQYSENGNGLGYTYLRLRGFDQRRIAVAINGIPQNDPESFDVFWINFFDLQGSISDIQVQRGASGSFYGSTGIGGGINIVAQPYSPAASVAVTIGGGSFATRRYTATANSGLINDRYIAHARLSRVVSDGYRDWSWTEYWRYFAGLRRIGARSVLTIQTYGGPQYDGLAFTGIPKAANTETVTDDFGTEIDRRYNLSAATRDVERFNQPHIELHHEWTPRPGVAMTQRAFWIRGVGYFDFDGSFRSADYLRLPSGIVPDDERDQPLFLSLPGTSVLLRAFLDQWQIGYQPTAQFSSAAGETSVGGEVRLHRSLRWGRIQESNGLPQDLVGSANDVRVYSVRGENLIGSLFGSHLARPTESVAVQADASLTFKRYRVFDEDFFGTSFSKPYVFFNPRLGATLFPGRPLSAFASVALARREPRLKALYDGEEAGAGGTPQFHVDSGGNFDFDAPFVTPESVLDIELGFRSEQRTWEATATFYYMRFQDEIVPSGGLDQFGVPRTGNADRTLHAGVEVSGQVRVVPGLDIWGNATFSRNRFVEFTEYVNTGPEIVGVERDNNTIAGFPSTILNAGIRYSMANWSVDLSTRYRGSQFVDNGGGRDASGLVRDNLVVDPYHFVDLGVRYSVPGGPLRGLSAALDVSNLTNRRVLLYGNSGFGAPQFFPAATRHVMFALTYTIR